MTDETIVAVYDTAAHAEAAVASLKAASVPENAISVHANSTTNPTGAAPGTPAREPGFWSGLFGGEPDHDTAVYDRSLEGGSTVVTVKVPAPHIDRVMEILESHHPVDIDERATGYGLNQTTRAAETTQPTAAAVPASQPVPPASRAATGNATGGEEVLQLSEESLAIGKRVVNRGGTRIRRFVVETPVEEAVSLHSEKVTLERHPVTGNRTVTDDAFTDKTIEMTESTEEPVVSKTAHVYEEVGLRKEATDRTETIQDKVRKEEVDIEQIPGKASTGSIAPDPLTPKG